MEPGIRDLATLAASLDIVSRNEKEALLSGERTLDDALRVWQARARLVVVKRGPEGCLWARPDATGSAPLIPSTRSRPPARAAL